MKYGWTDGRTDRHTAVQRETIVPSHYRVAGYKNTISCHFSVYSINFCFDISPLTFGPKQ